MTAAITPRSKWVIALGLPTAIFIICYIITLTPKFTTHTTSLSNAILADMLFTAPLLYFLAIRKTTVSKLTVGRVFIIALILASFILQDTSNVFLQVIKTFVSPAIEAALIFFIGRKFYLAHKHAKALQSTRPDFLLHCRIIMQEVTGSKKMGNAIASEICVLYYAFFGTRDKRIDNNTAFSNYRDNGITTVLWAILFLFLVETTGTHFLLQLWSPMAAWIITTLSIYTCLQVFAHIKAVKARPIRLTHDTLEIHNGLAGDAYIRLNNIEKFEITKQAPQAGKVEKIALLKGMENHNVVIHLAKPMQVYKIFGIEKTADIILFYVDKPDVFAKALTGAIEKISAVE